MVPGRDRAWVLAAVVASGCVQPLPPAAMPEQVIPRVRVHVSAVPDMGQVLIDTVDGEARVYELLGVVREDTLSEGGTVVADGRDMRSLCTSPCVANLPYGFHALRLRLSSDPKLVSTVFVEVGPRPRVIRHAFGRTVTHLRGTDRWGSHCQSGHRVHAHRLLASAQRFCRLWARGFHDDWPVKRSSWTHRGIGAHRGHGDRGLQS